MDWSRRSLLTTAAVAGWSGRAAGTPFPDKQWNRRLFLIFAPSDDHAGFKRMRAQTRNANFTRRDLDLVTVTGDTVRENGEPIAEPTARELRRVYGVPAGAFEVRLVGKDGGVKLARAGAVRMDEVYALIDSMPMRQEEMRQRGQLPITPQEGS